MTQKISNILVSVDLTPQHLLLAEQAAQIAQQGDSTLILLYVLEMKNMYRFSNWINSIGGKENMLETWKKYLSKNYGINIKSFVEVGNKKNKVIEYAKMFEVEMIIQKYQKPSTWFGRTFNNTELSIINSSKSQVITVFSDKKNIIDWQNVVIPVTDFVPEKRVKTILNVVNNNDAKINLIAYRNNFSSKGISDLLTDTLKLVKLLGNIRVECSYLNKGINTKSNKGFLDYARNINADILMTNVFFKKPPPLKSIQESLSEYLFDNQEGRLLPT